MTAIPGRSPGRDTLQYYTQRTVNHPILSHCLSPCIRKAGCHTIAKTLFPPRGRNLVGCELPVLYRNSLPPTPFAPFSFYAVSVSIMDCRSHLFFFLSLWNSFSLHIILSPDPSHSTLHLGTTVNLGLFTSGFASVASSSNYPKKKQKKTCSVT